MASNIRTDNVLGPLELRTNGYWCAEPTVAGHPVSVAIGLTSFSDELLSTALKLARQIILTLSHSDVAFREAITKDLLSLYNEEYRLEDDPELDAGGLQSQLQPKWVEVGIDAGERLSARIIYTAEDLFDGRGVEIWISPESLHVEMVNLT